MKVIAVWNFKGGSGKTTTSINLAYNLSSMYRVLVLDLDPQRNTVSYLSKELNQGKTIYEVIVGDKELSKVTYRSKYKNIDFVYGSRKLPYKDLDVTLLATELGKMRIQDKYDYVIIDCGPAETDITYLALNSADILLTPINLDQYCRDNLITVHQILNDVKANFNNYLSWHVFINEYAPKSKTQQMVLEELQESFDYPIMDSAISYSRIVQNSASALKPLMKHRSKNTATLDYIDLTEELIGIGKGES